MVLMAKKGKKAAKEENTLSKKLGAVGMMALSAFAGSFGTKAAEAMFSHPAQPSVVVVIDKQTESQKTYKPIYPETWQYQPSADPPAELYRINISGHDGLKQDFVIKTAPQTLALPALASIDQHKPPGTPSLAVKTNLWGAPAGYSFVADQNHMLNYFAENLDLDPSVKEALSKVTEIQITKADNPGKTAENNPGAVATDPDKSA